MVRLTTVAVVAGLTAFGCLALGAVLFVAEGPESTQRLGLFFGIVAIVMPVLLGMLRSDQAATQTNGALEDRMRKVVLSTLAERRRTDPATPTPDDLNPNDPVKG